MSASAPSALSTKLLPLHSLCYLETFPMAHDRRSLPRVKSMYWYAINSWSTPLSTKCASSLLNPFVCACKSSYPNTDCLVWSILTMTCPFHLMSSQFNQHNHIDHITSSPHFPRSNGFIERQVRTLNTMLSTLQEAKKTLEDLLLDLQSTPIESNMPSPQEILHRECAITCCPRSSYRKHTLTEPIVPESSQS